jgi:hypothetical protein
MNTMKKTNVLVIGFLLAFTMLIGLTSAFTFVGGDSLVLDSQGGEFTVVLTNTTNITEIITSIEIENIMQGTESIIFDTAYLPNYPVLDSNNQNITFVVEYYTTSGFDFLLGETYSTLLEVNGTEGQKNMVLSFPVADYCEGISNPGNLEIKDLEVKTISGFGDDKSYWYPLDTIEVSFEIENGNSDVDDIEIEWIIYSGGQEIMDGEESDFNLKDDKSQDIVFEIILDENIEDFGNDATIYIRAKGKIDDSGSNDDGNYTCDSDFVEVEMNIESNFVILSDFEIEGMTFEENALDQILQCDNEIIIRFDAFNIGEGDQEDLYVTIYNGELGIYERIDISELDAFEDEGLQYTLVLPEELEEKWYSLEFEVYDEDNDLYENSEDDVAKFNIIFEVEGNCELKAPIVEANLNGEAIEEEEIVVDLFITNVGNSAKTYKINPALFTEWAEFVGASESEFLIDAGETKQISLTFIAKKDSAGDQTFDLEILSDNQVILKQPIGLSIEKASWNPLKDINADWKIIGFVVLNLILILAIILVARRVLKR